MKCLFFIAVSLLILTLCMTAYAMTPPYGYATNDINDMRVNLEKYISYYPEGSERGDTGYGQSSPESRLEHRRVVLVDVEDPSLSLRWCGYRERAWGSGVNYIFAEFAETLDYEIPPDMTVTLYYDYDDPSVVYQNHDSGDFIVSMTVEEGIYNGMPYSAATKINRNGVEFSMTQLVVGDILVTIYDSGPFAESRLGLLRFEETDMMLPVYILEQTGETEKNDTVGDGAKQDEISVEKPDSRVWMYFGIAVALIGAAGCVTIWKVRSQRKRFR